MDGDDADGDDDDDGDYDNGIFFILVETNSPYASTNIRVEM